MLKNKFDQHQPYRAVAYLRMSTKSQNPRSPDQQLDEINAQMKRMGVPWSIIANYRDEGKSGKTIRNRPEYQRMMQDIASGKIRVDLILVDTLERLGRVDDMPQIRARLAGSHGVLVLTCDSGFADPTTTSGRALGFVETIRSTEDGRVKAHNVLRGKRDAIRQGKWPGGVAPLGYKLESVMKELNGCLEIDYKRPVPDPSTTWIAQLLFSKAREPGWGGARLAQFLTQHPDIPAELKPFHVTTVLWMLDNPLYKGELLWEKHSTGIVNDVRVLEPNDEDEMVRVPGHRIGRGLGRSSCSPTAEN